MFVDQTGDVLIVAKNEGTATRGPVLWERIGARALLFLVAALVPLVGVVALVSSAEAVTLTCTRPPQSAEPQCTAAVSYWWSTRVVSVPGAVLLVSEPSRRDAGRSCTGLSDATGIHDLAQSCLFAGEDVYRVNAFLRPVGEAPAEGGIRVAADRRQFALSIMGLLLVASLALVATGLVYRHDIVWMIDRRAGILTRVQANALSVRQQRIPLAELGAARVQAVPNTGEGDSYGITFERLDLPPAWVRDSARTVMSLNQTVTRFIAGEDARD